MLNKNILGSSVVSYQVERCNSKRSIFTTEKKNNIKENAKVKCKHNTQM